MSEENDPKPERQDKHITSVIARWDAGYTYRLVARLRFQLELRLEKLGECAMGEPRWESASETSGAHLIGAILSDWEGASAALSEIAMEMNARNAYMQALNAWYVRHPEPIRMLPGGDFRT